MAKKPWSISTTLRNPERLRNFLITLQLLEYSTWDQENQKKFQILLVQKRFYGYGERQFYKGLSQDKIDLIDDPSKKMSFEQAEDIFNEKNYMDPAMRGRQSINVLKKLGFVVVRDNKVVTTDLGKSFLEDNFDFEEVFFRSFLKWQIPNPGSDDYSEESEDYDIKPFVGTLHLIDAVNKKAIARGKKPKGISKQEFSIFAPTLVRYQDIDNYAEEIISLRQKQQEISDSDKKGFASRFLKTKDQSEIDKLLKNLRDYGDNAIRYFRLTGYIHIRGGAFYVDIEPRRSIEIASLLAQDNAQSMSFEAKEDYFAYMSDISEPKLPWETVEKSVQIIENLVKEVRECEEAMEKQPVEIKEVRAMQGDELKKCIADLRVYRRGLQDEKDHKDSQAVERIESYIEGLENIFSFEDRPAQLEKFAALSLRALNDALKIQPNYPVGDDNEPTFTAPGNRPDIECFYESFYAICEVTLLRSRDQWYHEGQPVMRHLRDFEKNHPSMRSYCLFIAPSIHRDTLNTFWASIKYGYEGREQRIVPLSINNFVSILRALLDMKSRNKFLRHTEILRLFDMIVDSSNFFRDSNHWIESFSSTIASWRQSLVFEA